MPNDMITTVGQLNPLGFYRLKVVDFYLSLLRTRYIWGKRAWLWLVYACCGRIGACLLVSARRWFRTRLLIFSPSSRYKSIDNAFTQHGTLKIILDLFFTYRWNNFLHSIVEQIILTILECQNDDLKHEMLVNAGLLDRIVEANKLNISEGYTQPPSLTLLTRSLTLVLLHTHFAAIFLLSHTHSSISSCSHFLPHAYLGLALFHTCTHSPLTLCPTPGSSVFEHRCIPSSPFHTSLLSLAHSTFSLTLQHTAPQRALRVYGIFDDDLPLHRRRGLVQPEDRRVDRAPHGMEELL